MINLWIESDSTGSQQSLKLLCQRNCGVVLPISSKHSIFFWISLAYEYWISKPKRINLMKKREKKSRNTVPLSKVKLKELTLMGQ